MVATPVQLTWLGGNPGDGWYEMTEGLVDLLNGEDSTVRFTLVAGGGEQNLDRVDRGQGDIGMSIDVVVSAAVNGAAPFTEPLRGVHSLGTGWSPLPYNLLAAADAPGDFRSALTRPGIRVGAPPTDTTDELMFQRAVAHYGTSYDEIRRGGGAVVLDGYDALVGALSGGEIDYVFGATTMPAPSIAQAAGANRTVELVSLPKDLIDHLVCRYGCRPGVIPAGTYPGLQRDDVSTAFVDTVFVVSAAVPEAVAYEVTRLLLTQRRRLPEVHPSLAGFNPFTAWRNTAAPLHPGAARAFRELGFMS